MHTSIAQSEPSDIDEIFNLYQAAANFQRSKKTVVVWSSLGGKWNSWRKLLIEGAIACVWAIAFQDPQIWEERDRDPAIYIHRIANAPQFRGRALVKHLVQWAKVYAEKQQKKFVRLDTLGENTRLIAYYQEMGFDFLDIFPLKNTAGLPAHYHNAPACLFEIQL